MFLQTQETLQLSYIEFSSDIAANNAEQQKKKPSVKAEGNVKPLNTEKTEKRNESENDFNVSDRSYLCKTVDDLGPKVTQRRSLLSKEQSDKVKSLCEEPSVCAEGSGNNPDSAESADQKENNLILADEPNLYKKLGKSVSQNFIKFIQSERSSYLRKKHPNAFLLLSVIAERAASEKDELKGLEAGDAIIDRKGASQDAGITENEYRTALKILEEKGYVEIVFCTSKGITKRITRQFTRLITIVNIKDKDVWNVSKNQNHQTIHQIILPKPPDNSPDHFSPKPPDNSPDQAQKGHSRRINTKNTCITKEAREMSMYLWECIHTYHPNNKPPNLDKWAKEVDKIFRLDKRSWEDIKKVFDFAIEHSFWVTVILSPHALRKSFEKILAQMTPVDNQGNREKQNTDTAYKVKTALKNCGEGQNFAIHQKSVRNLLTGQSISLDLPTETFDGILIKWFGLNKS